MKSNVKWTVVALAGAALTAPALGNYAVRFEARSDDGSQIEIYEVQLADFWVNEAGNLFWELTSDWDMGGLGSLSTAAEGTNMEISTSRAGVIKVDLNFSVAAGVGNTAFSIMSGPQATGITNAIGIADATVSVTDTFGDGATISPDGSGMYSALFNGANVFTDLLGGSVSTGAFGTNTGSDTFGFAAVDPNVTEASSEWHFTLSSLDLASGTSTYEIVPAPGTLALLGMGALATRRRRR